MRVAIFVNLFFWFSVIASGQIPNQLHIVGTGTELSGELLDKSVKDANGQVCAGLAIQSDLEGLSFEANNGVVKLNHTSGEDFLFLSVDERVVTVRNSGFLPFRILLNDYGIHLGSGSVWQLKITGDKPQDAIPVSIISNPPGATVFIDNVNCGNGPAFRLSPGKHLMRLEKDGYGSIEETKEVSVNSALFTFALKEVDVALVTVTSDPPGADLNVDGNAKGQTNRSIFLLPGSYRFTLEKPDYLRVDTLIAIRETAENRLAFTLIRNMGTLHLALAPVDASVRVNQKEVDASKPFDLAPGEYEVVVSKHGFLPYTETIQIRRGATLSRTIVLDRNAGTLHLIVIPPSATIRINREDYTGKTMVELSPGAYRLELSSAGCDSLSETVQIARGSTIEKSYALRQKVGKLQFNVVPIEARVTFMREGQEVEEWIGARYARDVPVGEYDLLCRLEGYKSSRQKVHIRDRQVEKVEVVMENGSDAPPDMVLVEGGDV